HKDGHSRARQVVDFLKVEGEERLRSGLDELIERVAQRVISEIVEAGGRVELDDQDVGLVAGGKAGHDVENSSGGLRLADRQGPWMASPPTPSPMGSVGRSTRKLALPGSHRWAGQWVSPTRVVERRGTIRHPSSTIISRRSRSMQFGPEPVRS